MLRAFRIHRHSHRFVTSLKQAKHNLIDNTDIFVFDCDGVLWRGGHPISGAMNTISLLRDMKKQLYFVTNSTESRSSLIKKFQKFGIKVEDRGICSKLCIIVFSLKFLRIIFIRSALG